MYQSTKKPGNISSAFSNTFDNKSWPEKFKTLKDELNPNNVEESWTRLVAAFDTEIDIIQRRGPDAVPQVQLKDIKDNGDRIPGHLLEEIKKRGVVVVRNVVDRDTALQYKEDIKEYIRKNREKIVGFPESNPQVWEVYWSKPQFAARSHPNFQLAAGAINQIWHADPGTSIDLSTNVTYCDRLRIRQPGDTSFTLKEHVDGGSVERWEDPEYRKCYKNILEGNWELHDPFDATHRVNATMDLYNCDGGCSMFRSFQGWMSLSDVSPGGGTLRVCPLIKLTTAYIILRPFCSDLRNTANMAGAIPGSQQIIPEKLYPHILKAMVTIPKVAPGDCVFWHCDMVHAVEGECGSKSDSSVLYIPATPLCPINAKCLTKQRYAFQSGTSPPDFPLNNCEVDIKDRAQPDDLSELGKVSMGLKHFIEKENGDQNSQMAVKEANEILFP